MRVWIMLLFVWTQSYAIQMGQVPIEVTLSGKEGGKLDGTAWSSTMLKDKVYVLFYVDPDEKDTNNAFSDALRNKKFDLEKYGSVAIINMAATWMPNFAIEKSLKAKQKKYPNALYVKDKHKVLVKHWGLADDSSDILIIDKTGKVLYYKEGKLSQSEIEKVLALIEYHL